MADLPADLVPHIGPDGLPVESPVITYTEKVLEEKELQLKKVIQNNYMKIRNVERELASLALEIKLTAGPKKAALEHLRKKIELAGERIKNAKQKEENARKVWEAAAKVLKEEEDKKQTLCEDLNHLVKESAASQYARLEELKQRLEAFSPEVAGGTIQSNKLEDGCNSAAALHKSGVESDKLLSVLKIESNKQEHASAVVPDSTRAAKSSTGKADQTVLLKDNSGEKMVNVHGESQNYASPVKVTNGRNALVKGILRGQGTRPKPNSWTGAGFDVDDTKF